MSYYESAVEWLNGGSPKFGSKYHVEGCQLVSNVRVLIRHRFGKARMPLLDDQPPTLVPSRTLAIKRNGLIYITAPVVGASGLGRARARGTPGYVASQLVRARRELHYHGGVAASSVRGRNNTTVAYYAYCLEHGVRPERAPLDAAFFRLMTDPNYRNFMDEEQKAARVFRSYAAACHVLGYPILFTDARAFLAMAKAHQLLT